MSHPSHCKTDWQSTHIGLGEAQADAARQIRDPPQNLSVLVCLPIQLTKYRSKLLGVGQPVGKPDVLLAHRSSATCQSLGYDVRQCGSKIV